MSIFGGNTGMTYEQLQQKRKIAEQLMAANASRAPRNVGEGLTAIGNALLARSLNKKADARDKELRDEFNTQWGGLVGSMGGASVPVSDMGLSMGSTGASLPQNTVQTPAGELSMGAPDMTRYRDAIASIESAGSGDYQAVGPTNAKLGRALGRYQIMEANLPQWSQAALGRSVSADEFLASPEIQDAIFDHRFGQYVNQFGPEGAAQAWFAGPGGVGRMERQDVLGTSVADYTRKFNSALGGGSQQVNPAILMQMAEIASSPYASPGQKAVVTALMQRQMQQSDPLYQAKLAQAQQGQQPDTQYVKGVGLMNMQTGEVIRPAPEGEGEPATEYGLTPQYATNADGELVLIQLSKDGKAKETVLPEGLALQKGLEKVDTGTSFQWYNTFTGEAIGQPIPKNVREAASEAAAGATEGKAGAESKLSAPGAIIQADETMRLIDQVLNDPALPKVVGRFQGRLQPEGFAGLFMSQGALNLIPKIEQLQGKAFLQAFESLKGGGQITEREGQAATAAQARLQQRYVDDETYAEALRDLRRIADNAKRRAKGETIPEYIPEWMQNETGGGGDMTFEQFSQTQSAIDAAEKYGVTLEEMWEIKQGQN